MIAPAIIPALPNDSAADAVQPEGPASSQAPIADFDSLLLLFSADPVAEVGVTDEGIDLPDPDAAAPDAATAAAIALQLVLTPALISLYDQPKQVVANQPWATEDFSQALDLSPVYAPDRVIAQALPFEGRLPAELTQTAADLDGEETAAAAPWPASEQSAKSVAEFPQLGPLTEEIEPAPTPSQGVELAVAENLPKIAGEKGRKEKAGAEKLDSFHEDASPQRSAPISIETNAAAAIDPSPAPAENPTDKNLTPDKRRAPASGRVETDLPPENFTPPGLAVADARVAPHGEGAAMLPSERSGFFEARNDIPAPIDERIAPNAQASAPAHDKLFHALEREKPVEAPPANPFAAVIERVAAEISTHSRQGQHEVTIRLEPPELGNLKIELLLDGDRLQARVTAEAADTGDLIQTHLPELRQALQAHNLDLVNVQVDLGGWNGLGAGGLTQDFGSESGRRDDAAALSSTAQATEGESQEPTAALSPSAGAVSVWA